LVRDALLLARETSFLLSSTPSPARHEQLGSPADIICPSSGGIEAALSPLVGSIPGQVAVVRTVPR